MLVFYDENDGSILFTVNAKRPPQAVADKPYIETENALEELGCWKVIDGALVLVSLTPMMQSAIAELNHIAGEARKGLVTAIPGQEMIYLAKESEARAYVVDADPQMVNYPLLSAEVGITAPDAWSLAQLWLNMSSLWRSAAAMLENARAGAIQAVGAAQSPQEIKEIVNGFRAAMASISV